MTDGTELCRQCTATNRSGERCGLAPIPGGEVCAWHGGKAPLTVRAAKERLAFLVEPALEALHRILRHAPPCEHCGRSDDDKNPVVVRAATAVLDRCGFGPAMKLELSEAGSEFSDASLDDLIAKTEQTLERLYAMRDVESPALPVAVLVPNDDEEVEI